MEKNKNPGSQFTGFDTFTGLPEDWNFRYQKGHFSTEGKTPDIHDSRCSFEKGLFQDTLEKFVDQIIYLLDHPDEHQRIARMGKEFVNDHFKWEDQVKKMDEVIHVKNAYLLS